MVPTPTRVGDVEEERHGHDWAQVSRGTFGAKGRLTICECESNQEETERG